MAGYSPWGRKESDMTEATECIVYVGGLVRPEGDACMKSGTLLGESSCGLAG